TTPTVTSAPAGLRAGGTQAAVAQRRAGRRRTNRVRKANRAVMVSGRIGLVGTTIGPGARAARETVGSIRAAMASVRPAATARSDSGQRVGRRLAETSLRANARHRKT